MTPTATVIHGDARALPLPDNSVTTICCDPPYGLEFMGKAWDHGVPGVPFWTEALRVAKPGAHLLAFGGTRTWHRLAVAIEDAGWIMRDCVMWIYGTGFPKSHNISKGIGRAAGAGREIVGARDWSNAVMDPGRGVSGLRQSGGAAGDYNGARVNVPITAPATPDAQRFDGWGSALKPAYEPVILAQAPLDGTYAHNATEHGCGGLWIDGARIGVTPEDAAGIVSRNPGRSDLVDSAVYGRARPQQSAAAATLGRWPSNVILDEAAAAALDAQSGVTATGGGVRAGGEYSPPSVGAVGIGAARPAMERRNDTGGASRFFYVAKASRRERDHGVTGEPSHWTDGRKASADHPRLRKDTARRNDHPTVKPIAIMRHLLRLTRQPGDGGLVLDPFCGSGTTGIAAKLEGRDFVGVDLDAHHCDIARDRIAADWTDDGKPGAESPPRPAVDDVPPSEPGVLPGQLRLW